MPIPKTPEGSILVTKQSQPSERIGVRLWWELSKLQGLKAPEEKQKWVCQNIYKPPTYHPPPSNPFTSSPRYPQPSPRRHRAVLPSQRRSRGRRRGCNRSGGGAASRGCMRWDRSRLPYTPATSVSSGRFVLKVCADKFGCALLRNVPNVVRHRGGFSR